METYQIVILVVAAIIAALYIIQRFTGYKFMETIIQWQPVLSTICATVKAVSDALPSSDFKQAVVVLSAACEAAKTAEDLWKIGELPKEERNDYAQLLVAKTLQDAGVNVTEQVQAIIDGAIAVICLLMPHGIIPEVEDED